MTTALDHLCMAPGDVHYHRIDGVLYRCIVERVEVAIGDDGVARAVVIYGIETDEPEAQA